MTRDLLVRKAGPGVSVQDTGRPGHLGLGLSRGGAVDRLALAEGAALLGQDIACAVLEMAGIGGTFEAGADMRIALTGAPMRATIDGTPIAWNASHLLPAGAPLTIGAVEAGSYGYLHLGGGIDGPAWLGARSAHLAAGIVRTVQAGDRLPVGPDAAPGAVGMRLPASARFDGGTVRVVPSLQTDFFSPAQRARLESTAFRRDNRGSRMGIRLTGQDTVFHTEAGLRLLSEVVLPGDIQITGDGTPFVLLAECQTTGGYPRICAVLPCDLPIVAQAPPGALLRFRFVTLDEGVAAESRARDHIAGLRKTLTPLIRDPHEIRDLLGLQLISGVTAGDDLEG